MVCLLLIVFCLSYTFTKETSYVRLAIRVFGLTSKWYSGERGVHVLRCKGAEW